MYSCVARIGATISLSRHQSGSEKRGETGAGRGERERQQRPVTSEPGTRDHTPASVLQPLTERTTKFSNIRIESIDTKELNNSGVLL